MSDDEAEKKRKHDEELAKLFEETLREFKDTDEPKPKKTSDDDLDEFMAIHDQKAAQKAASDFQQMLSQMVQVQEEAMKKVESGEITDPQLDPNDPESKAMMDALKQLMECSSTVANASTAEEFMAGLEMLRSPDAPMEPFMQMIMQTLASKEVMYPPLKEIYDSYPKYLEEHGGELDAETTQRYKKQYEVLEKICNEFENQPDVPIVEPEAAASSPLEPNAPADGQEQVAEPSEQMKESAEHFERLGKLLVELQSYGYPPKELVGNLPDGWVIDESGLPKVENASAAADACTIIIMTISYASVVDRIYSRRASELYSNIAYLHHPSGVTVIVLRQIPESEVESIDFGSTKKHGADRSEKMVVGKGKKGGLLLQPDSKLCTIKCKNGEEIVVRAGVCGTLVEINDRLKTQPDLVRTAPENQGFIAVVTYGAGKRETEGFGEVLPEKRLHLQNGT
ncbi:unnamed protein product [Caenorhabditis bovis]|uniref:Peroxin-19 n=1 Tax=Caenorhabditis bovis TaxID=2654633 RepID=A0A8S1EQ02_9PELO|nr:unnamed protein product [Caenorhabditis bovis]